MTTLPKPGQLYYHFKRDPEKGLEHGAYLVLGVGISSEDRDDLYVVYKPLYYCDPRKPDEKGKSFFIRPLEDFFVQVDRDNYSGPRFWLVEDEKTIQYLKETFLYSSQYMDE